MELSGKHVLITGAARRLGRAIAEAMLPARIRLTAHYRTSEAEARSLVDEGRRQGSDVQPQQADLADTGSLRAMVAAAEKRFGPVDVLVLSASDFYPTPLFDVTEKHWDALMSVNLKGQFFLAQACARRMQEKGGVILTLADVNGARPMKSFTPYVITKAGVLMLTRNLAKELAPRIRVCSISPGPVLLPESYTEEQRERSAERTLLKRLGSAEDIAQAALFLVGNDYVTGLDLAVDGGRSLA